MCTQFSNPYSQIDDISMLNGISVCPVQTSPNVFLKHLIAFVYFNSYKHVRRWLKLDESDCYSFLPACLLRGLTKRNTCQLCATQVTKSFRVKTTSGFKSST